MAETTQTIETKVFGAPLSWIALSAAIIAATSLIPAFPYPEGGGFDALAAHLIPLFALILGPWAGWLAATIGGIIGMFICPPAYIMGFLTVVDNNMAAAYTMGAVAQDRWNWTKKLYIPFWISQIAITNIVPYYWPGPPKYSPVIQPEYFLSYLPWLIWFPIYLTPLGLKKVPEWLRSDNPKKLFMGVWLALAMQSGCWYYTWWWIYNVVFAYPCLVNLLQNVYYYSWIWYLKNTLLTPLYVAVIRALKRAGVEKVPGSVL
ncbi:hypothetical protein DRO48_02980 [Candidatus Bathyarchaeota archaeon]|nr:MAG: hypothetical protein DRO48_02980 [Candidatus Bathyarchaeota archaeon]